MEATVRKLALLLASFSAITGLLTLTAVAGPEDTVTATVTPVVISVIVTPDSVDYGPVQLNTSNAVPTGSPLDVRNNGTVLEDFEIKGSDTQNWTLAGAAGDSQFVHKFSTSGPPSFTNMTTAFQTLASDVAHTTGVVNVHLRMDMPTQSQFTTTQTTTITIRALMATP
jgi:hypothetical protein